MELLLQAERSLTVGQLDAAERVYRQIAGSDPRNSIAVVGLARVALERGDDRGAYAEAQRALTIDPENAAAQRMIARLDEVMRHRGETPPDATAGASLPTAGSGPTAGSRPTGAAGPTGAAQSTTSAAPTGAAGPTTPASAAGSGPTRGSGPTAASGPVAASSRTTRPATTRPSKRPSLLKRLLGR